MSFYVYRLFDPAGECLYVGATSHLTSRVNTHRRKQDYGDRINEARITFHESEPEALAVERAEISRLAPLHNGIRPSLLINDPQWLAARRDEGLTVTEIAALADVSRARVTQALKAHNLVRYVRPSLASPLLSDPSWLATAIEGGPTLAELAARASASKNSVRAYLHFHGLHEQWKTNQRAAGNAPVSRKGPPVKYPRLHEDYERLASDVAERGCTAVAVEIGCHVSSVMRALERAGYAVPIADVHHGAAAPEPTIVAAVATEYAAGATSHELAVKYGISVSTVISHVKRAGGEVRGRGRPIGRRAA